MATIFTDTFTGANGAAWSSTNWTIVSNNSGLADIQNNQGRLSAGSGATTRHINAISKNAARQNYDVTFLTRWSGGGGVSANAVYAARASVSTIVDSTKNEGRVNSGVYIFDAAGAYNTYWVQLRYKVAAGTITNVGSQIAITPGTAYRVRLQVIGNTARFKIWTDGSTEPATWNAETTTLPAIPDGQVAFLRGNVSSSTPVSDLYIDDVVVDDGATNVVNAGYTAEVVTASAMSKDAAFSFSRTANYAATPVTAIASTGDPQGYGNNIRYEVTEDAFTSTSNTTFNYGNADYMLLGNSYQPHLKFAAAPNNGSDAVASAQLWLTNTDTTTFNGTIQVYRINTDWSESTLTYANRPTDRTLLRTVSVTAAAGTSFSIDVSGADNGYGVALVSTASAKFIGSSEQATAESRPYVRYTLAAPASVSVNPGVATASALAVDATIDATRTVSVGTTAAQASAMAPEAVGSAETHVEVLVAAEATYAFAETPTAAFSVPLTVAATPAFASAEGLEVTAGTTRGVAIYATPATATARLVRPSGVNGSPIRFEESEDRYFQLVANQLPDTWLRLNDAGTTAKDRVTGNTIGSYIGVLTGQFDAPEGRHSAYFNGSALIDTNEAGDEVTPSGDFALEFSFRTAKANAFLMIGQDTISNVGGNTPGSAREVRLNGGKINFRQYRFGPGFTQSIDREFTGLRTLNDGQWHHVVIRSTDATNNNAQGAGTEIWIDGTLEMRRYGVSPFVGFPDYIGGRPNYIEFGSDLPSLAPSDWFEGDMSEIVFYSLSNLDKDAIPRHYYAIMGWKPVEATAATAFAFTPADHKGRGNQKRALALTWGIGENDFYDRGPFVGNNKTNFDPLLAFSTGTTTYAGYKVFGRKVTFNEETQKPYRDYVTDEVSLIDLERDVNLDDYDVIMFQDWPDEGYEIDAIEAEFPGQRERLLRQLRDANDKGIGLFVTHPRLAVDLGIIDRVEFVPTLKENRFSGGQGNASGLYDYGSAYKFPWNIAGSSGLIGATTPGSPFNGEPTNRDPSFLASKAFYYGDTNKNDRFRVRALVEGLTDIPSYMIQDAIFQVDYAAFGWSGVAYKYLHRLDGLQIGDEYIFHGTDFGMFGNWRDLFDYAASRNNGTWATPMANVKAGTIVTTFGAKHWLGQQEVDNPYRDYATTIVLEPGDSLAGRPVGGKIFVNFTEQPSLQPEGVVTQVLPLDGNGWPAGYVPDTAEQREWEWSFTRKTLSTTNTSGTEAVTFVDPLGNRVTVNAPAGGGDLAMVRSSNLFPLEAFPSYQMVRRGLFWLMEKVEEASGDKTVRVAPANASATAQQPAVHAQRDATVRAEVVRALVVAPRVAEDTNGDVEVTTLPATAYVTVTGYSRVIAAEPALAHAEAVENLDAVTTTGEQVVLTIYRNNATLYLKEEA